MHVVDTQRNPNTWVRDKGNKVITVELDISEDKILCQCSFANALFVSLSKVLSLLLENFQVRVAFWAE